MRAGLQNLGKQLGPGEKWQLQLQTKCSQTVSRELVISDCLANDKKRNSQEDVKAKWCASRYTSTDNTRAVRRVYSRHDGRVSPDEIDDGVPQDHLEQLKCDFYSTKVKVCAQETKSNEWRTIDQADDKLWMNERRNEIANWIKGQQDNKDESNYKMQC